MHPVVNDAVAATYPNHVVPVVRHTFCLADWASLMTVLRLAVVSYAVIVDVAKLVDHVLQLLRQLLIMLTLKDVSQEDFVVQDVVGWFDLDCLDSVVIALMATVNDEY